MSSQIIDTNPTAGSATTQSVRDNFAFAKNEINEHYRMSEGMQTTGGSATAYTATFSPAVVLATGVRVTVKFNAANTGADPTITVDGSNAKVIKRADGDALVAGEIGLNQIGDLIYDGTNFRLLSGTDVPTLVKLMLGAMYPIGHILTTVKANNPGTADYFFTGVTFGTWTAFGAGKTMFGIDSSDTDFDTAEETGGAKTATLNQDNMKHNHQWMKGDNSGSGDRAFDIEDTGSAGSGAATFSATAAEQDIPNQSRFDGVDAYTALNRAVTGSDPTAFSIVNPYIVTRFWKRTA